MALKLSADQLQAMQAHADRTYPNECCGLLLGQVQAEDKLLVTVRSVENAWNPALADSAEATLTQSRRYSIAPEAMLTAMREARSHNLEVIGVYHSHPDNPAVPSECDRQQAWPQYSYLIVSVPQGRAQECRSWVLDDRHQFLSEAIRLVS